MNNFYNDKELVCKLKKAKKKGLEAIENFIYSYESNYYLEIVSKKTLSNLLKRKFKNINEALDFDDKIEDIQTVTIILLKVINKDGLKPTIIIESILTNE